MPRVELFQPASQIEQGSFYSERTQVNNVDTEIDLGEYFTTVTIAVEAGTNGMHVNPNDAEATTDNFLLPPGTSWTYQGMPIRYFHLLSTGAADNYVSIIATA